MQRIEVKRFGPLNDIILDIKDYMVFIGPQASGKSTLAKLIYFFWKIEDKFNQEILPTFVLNKLLRTHREDVNYIENWKKDIRILFEEIFPTYRNGKISFFYKDDHEIKFDVLCYSENLTDDVVISNGFTSKFAEIDERIKNSPDLTKLVNHQNSTLTSLINILSSEVLASESSNGGQNSDRKRVFIPAGRGILSLFANSLTVIGNNSLDHFNENFVKFTNTTRKFLESSHYSDNFGWMPRLNPNISDSDVYKIANDLSYAILKGDFGIDNRGDGIMHYYNDSGYLIPLKYTSSGQQESIWLINLLQYLLYGASENNFDVIIEEPEAHLFPDAQRDITNLITLLAGQAKSQNRTIVTTHSPYVLATLNNSIKAFTVGQMKDKYQQAAKILNPNLWINPTNLLVGFMKKNEQQEYFYLQDIFDHEINLIKHEVLDNVSDKIMTEFDELLDIQYSE